MVALEKSPESVEDLDRLAHALESIELGVSLVDLDADRDALLKTVRDYLMPRRLDPTAPLTVVFAGPTGSGKSTLVNSLARRPVSPTGPLRPTTRGPIALLGDADAELVIGGVDVSQVEGSAPILEAMTLIDTPDIDSTAIEHRVMAEALIDHADVVVFVTSALRYADDAPWQVLRRAQSRGATVVNVLNRLTSETAGAVVDFKSRLNREGLDGGGLVVISEHHISSERERVPSLAIKSLSRVLAEVAHERESQREGIAAKVLNTVVIKASSLADRIDAAAEILESVEAEIDLSLNSRPQRIEWPNNVAVSFPKNDRRWTVRRWMRQPDPVKLAATHVDLLASAVRADLLTWALDARPEQVSLVDATSAIDDAAPLIESAVRGWVHGLDAIVAAGPKSGWPDAARTSLVRRVEVVYRHVSDSIIERARLNVGAAGSERLRKTLPHLVDA